jgi:hypothetical protein
VCHRVRSTTDRLKLASLMISEEATAPVSAHLPHAARARLLCARFLHICMHTCNCTVSFISSKLNTFVEKLLNI